MKITVERIKHLTTTGKLKAFLDVNFDGVVVNGAKIFEGPSGLFAALPSQMGKDEKYYPTVEISDPALKSEFNRVCLAAYGPSPETIQAAQNAGLITPTAQEVELSGNNSEVPF